MGLCQDDMAFHIFKKKETSSQSKEIGIIIPVSWVRKLRSYIILGHEGSEEQSWGFIRAFLSSSQVLEGNPEGVE